MFARVRTCAANGMLTRPIKHPCLSWGRFSAIGGQLGPLTQHPTAIDIRLVADCIEVTDELLEPRDLDALARGKPEGRGIIGV